jgi:hypothetical protein
MKMKKEEKKIYTYLAAALNPTEIMNTQSEIIMLNYKKGHIKPKTVHIRTI